MLIAPFAGFENSNYCITARLSLGAVVLFLSRTCCIIRGLIRYVLSSVAWRSQEIASLISFCVLFHWLQSFLRSFFSAFLISKFKLKIIYACYWFCKNSKWRHLFVGYCWSKMASGQLGNIHLLLLALTYHLCWFVCWIYTQVCE